MVGDMAYFTEVIYLYPSSFVKFPLPFSIPSYIEGDIEDAIASYKRSDYTSISRTSAIFNIPSSTLSDRLRKVKTRY